MKNDWKRDLWFCFRNEQSTQSFKAHRNDHWFRRWTRINKDNRQRNSSLIESRRRKYPDRLKWQGMGLKLDEHLFPRKANLRNQLDSCKSAARWCLQKPICSISDLQSKWTSHQFEKRGLWDRNNNRSESVWWVLQLQSISISWICWSKWRMTCQYSLS